MKRNSWIQIVVAAAIIVAAGAALALASDVAVKFSSRILAAAAMVRVARAKAAERRG